MSLVYDEYGQPFLIVKEQENKTRISGLDAQRGHILAAKGIGDIMKTSLGPRGMDKILISSDGEITVTNDGATMLELMDIKNEIGKLLVSLSKSQDDEIGDGTTSVVILASALLEQAEDLLEKGIHPVKISQGYTKACKYAINYMEKNSESIDLSSLTNYMYEDESNEKQKEAYEILMKTALTCLGSKIVKQDQVKFAKMAIDAVLAVADFKRGDVDFELIKIESKLGGELEDSIFVRGVVIDKEISHFQMKKTIENAKIAILTCPFEPPKPKTKHKLDIKNVKEYYELQQYEKDTFKQMISYIKNSSANLVACQWGFDDEANHLLLANEISAIRWIGGVEMELLAIATEGMIVGRFEDLKPEKLGKAGKVREISFGTANDKAIIVEGCPKSRTVTIFIRGGSKMLIDEAKRSLHDAICTVRNLIRSQSIVYGGGSVEMACSTAILDYADTVTSLEQYSMRAFAKALESIPLALIENSGFSKVDIISKLKSLQIKLKNPRLGVDCLGDGIADMKERFVIDPTSSKRSQFLLATQLAKMILKVDDVIVQGKDTIN